MTAHLDLDCTVTGLALIVGNERIRMKLKNLMLQRILIRLEGLIKPLEIIMLSA
jgi:hypothetical protein